MLIIAHKSYIIKKFSLIKITAQGGVYAPEWGSTFQFGAVQGTLLFLICIHPTILENMISDKISKGARNLSSILFLTHTASLTILGELFHVWDSPVRYMATLSFSVLLFLIVGKTKMGFLKWLLMQK